MKKNKWLFCDIGNSYTDLVLTDFVTMDKVKAKTNGDYDKALNELFEDKNVKDVIAYISSVNKKGFQSLTKALLDRNIVTKYLTQKRMELFAKLNNYDIPNISILGQDLFCDLIATESNVFRVIVDIGTATKILAIDERDHFLGASILPGPNLFPKSIYGSTDIKGDGKIKKDAYLLSLDTDECLSSGALYGTAASVVNMIRLICKELEVKDLKVYVTGGASQQIKNHLELFGLNIFTLDTNLTIEGLARAFEFKKYDHLNWIDED